MSATLRDFAFERSCIEASNDDRAVLDWMHEYQEDRGQAQASGDEDVVQELDDLLEFAEDRVVEIKEARNAPATPARADPVSETRRAATELVVAQRATSQLVRVEGHLPERPQRRERDEAAVIAAAKQIAAEKAAAEQAAAESNRRDDEELRELRERASKAEARRMAAEAQTARLKAQQQQAAAEQERERRQRAKERAAKAAKEQERAADAAEAAARAAAQAVPEEAAMPAPIVPRPQDQQHASAASDPRPVGVPSDLTPIARLFREQLAEVGLAAPAPATPNAASVATQPATRAAAKVPPAPPPSAADPLDDLPPLTGADLTSYRTWLGVSQRALATKLTVEQSVISKIQGKGARRSAA